MIYITTDSHLGHDKILEYCSRPKNFETLIIDGYLSLTESDTLIHLGDVCMGADQRWHDEVIKQMKCKKILCRGNHDHKSNTWYLQNGWDFVCTSFTNRYFGLNIKFSHKPVTWDGYFDVNIHGHLHDLSHRIDEQSELTKLNYLISLENMGYSPLLLRTIVEDINRQMKGK